MFHKKGAEFCQISDFKCLLSNIISRLKVLVFLKFVHVTAGLRYLYILAYTLSGKPDFRNKN